MFEGAPNYADVVKRSLTSSGLSPQVVTTKEEMEKCEDQEKKVLAQASITKGTADKDSRGPLTKEGIDAVQPYIPSYLAALKICKPTVMLEGVPLKVNRNHDTCCSSTNVSNSLLEPESTSSWADDDDDFLLCLARSQQQKGLEMRAAVPHQGAGGSRRSNNMNESQCRFLQQSGRQAAEGGDDGVQHSYHGHKGRGWRKVEKGAPPSRNQGKNRGRQNGGRQGNNATQNSLGSTTPNPTFLSGGRFDVLANAKIMKLR